MFRRKKRAVTTKVPTTPTEYPSGTFVHSEEGWFYIFNETKRYSISSERVLGSWAPPRVVETSEAALAKYRVVAPLKFRNGSLVRNVADGTFYLIEGGKKRHIVSPDVYTNLGIDPYNPHLYAWAASEKEIALHDNGKRLG